MVILVEKGEDFSKKVQEATGGHGVDLAIDNVGSSIFNAVLRSMAYGGRWVLVGQLTGDFVSFNPAQLFLRSVNLLSALNASKNQLEEVLNMIRDGWITPQIAGIYPLEQAAEVHAVMENGGFTGRAILKPNGIQVC
jgi:acryloyl-coenzyme A reductase